MISLNQTQKLQQRLSPQQIQYLKFLQLPIVSLEQLVKQEIELNPMIEEIENEIDEENNETQSEELEEDKNDENENEQIEFDENGLEEFSLEELYGSDLEDYNKESNYNNDDDERNEIPFEDKLSLQTKLLMQIQFLNLDEHEKFVAEEIIGNLDSDGYFRYDLKQLITHLPFYFSLENAETILKKIQIELEPVGITARNLKECLLAQLQDMNSNKNQYEHQNKHSLQVAILIVSKYFEEYENKKFQKILNEISENELKLGDALIKTLNPKPGEASFENPIVVVPDFIVKKDDSSFIVEMNNINIPQIRINKSYIDILADNNANSEAKNFLKLRFESAKTFLSNINERYNTLNKVMNAIVFKQKNFFENGSNLKPIIIKDISEIVGLDISTISRAINGKYVQTQFGVFPLKYFFSKKLHKTSGEDISNKEIQETIKMIIKKENKRSPFTDDEIVEELKKTNTQVARRTVAKYREQMKIPVSRLRKTI